MSPRGICSSILFIFVLGACREPGGPDATYRDFARAARGGDAGLVYSLLSERSRAVYDEEAKALAARYPWLVSSGRNIVLGDLSAGAPRLSKVLVVRESLGAAVLLVTVEGSDRQEEVKMVQEKGHWRVVLPETPATP